MNRWKVLLQELMIAFINLNFKKRSVFALVQGQMQSKSGVKPNDLAMLPWHKNDKISVF